MNILIGVLLVFGASSAQAVECDSSRIEQVVLLDKLNDLQALTKSCQLDPRKLQVRSQSALFAAAEFDAVKVLSWLLSEGALVNQRDFRQQTPLHLARSVDAATALIKAGAEVQVIDDFDRTPFGVMLALEDWELLDYLRSEGATIRERDLTWAGDYYRLSVLQYLAKRSVEKEIKGTGKFFRYFFFYEESYQELAKAFLLKGANIDLARTHSSRRRPIEIYVRDAVINAPEFQRHGLKAIRFLLEWGADVNGPTANNIPLVHEVVGRKDFASTLKIMDLFLTHGMDLNLSKTPDRGETVLMSLVKQRGEAGDNANYQEKMLNYLLARGADANAQANDGSTALHLAIRWANDPAALKLTEATDLSLKNGEGLTPLEYAYQRLSQAHSALERRALIRIIHGLEG